MRGMNTIELIFRRRAARYTGMRYSRNVSPSRCLLDWHERCQSTKRLETGEGCMCEVRVPPLQGIPGKPTIRNARKYHAPYNDIKARNPRMKRHKRVQDTKSARIGEAALNVWRVRYSREALNVRRRHPKTFAFTSSSGILGFGFFFPAHPGPHEDEAMSLKPSSPDLGTHVPRSARGKIDVTQNT
ncbi:hypothetical protein B0H13DRAFT_1900313 [Mycena leptocephala]|nr:hypothetical protein B0H13DRAFT_1900313 [Mycena leptocephala]